MLCICYRFPNILICSATLHSLQILFILLKRTLFSGYSRLYCLLTGVWSLYGSEMSQIMMVAIAIDRLIAISSPIFYKTRNQRKYAIGSFLVATLVVCTKYGISVIGVDFSVQPSRCTSGKCFWISRVMLKVCYKYVWANWQSILSEIFYSPVYFSCAIFSSKRQLVDHQYHTSSNSDIRRTHLSNLRRRSL